MQDIEYAVRKYQGAGKCRDRAGKLSRRAQLVLELRSATHAVDARPGAVRGPIGNALTDPHPVSL
jgi:hypothetical protein